MKQRSTLALPILASALLAFSPAHADKALDLFRTFCADTNVDTSLAVAAADKAGWMPMPDSLLEKFNENLHMTGAQGRMMTGADGMYMLLTTNGAVTINQLTGRVCTVAVAATTASPTSADFDDQISAFANVPPAPRVSNGFVIYAWRAGAEHSHLTVPFDEKNLKASMADGTLQILMTKHDDKMLMILMIAPTDFSEDAPAAKSEDRK
ncbi:MAG TPA: hypothetical protein VMF58_05785 [Rhizomicrobium sp.]|nr:hypothetical protein [Rhizomicrobium sp.]